MSQPHADDPTPAEWQVLSLIWREGPLATREVLSQLQAEQSWSTSTIKTLLRRLVDKGHLKTKAVGNSFVYSARRSPQAALRRAGEELISRAHDDSVAPLLAHLVRRSKLDSSELSELRQLIEELSEEDRA